MSNSTIKYIFRRIGIFLLTVFISATLIFLISRALPGDPVETMYRQLEMQSGQIEQIDQIIGHYKMLYGLNEPPIMQYCKYLWNTFRFEFGFSYVHYPTSVALMISRALPWSLGLGIVSILITFLLGNTLGAIFGWERTPRFVKATMPINLLFTSVPPVLSSLFMLSIFAIHLGWFPLTGSYSNTVTPGWNWPFIGSILKYGALPVISIILVNTGWTILGMRSMVITTAGEDYVQLAEAKGLKPLYTLYRYRVRNALLPQLTSLALSMGGLVSGQVLVEMIFGYPGMGTLLFRAIREQDFPVIQAISFIVILIIAISVLAIDLLYPLIDPRITHGGE